MTLEHHISKDIFDNTQLNSKCWLCCGRNEVVIHIISEWRKQTQKEYKSKHDWVGRMVNWELYCHSRIELNYTTLLDIILFPFLDNFNKTHLK